MHLAWHAVPRGGSSHPLGGRPVDACEASRGEPVSNGRQALIVSHLDLVEVLELLLRRELEDADAPRHPVARMILKGRGKPGRVSRALRSLHSLLRHAGRVQRQALAEGPGRRLVVLDGDEAVALQVSLATLLDPKVCREGADQ